jgi:serine acetyltransferase
VVDVVDGARMSAFRSPMVGDRAAETRSPRAAAANCEHKFWARGWSDYHADVDRFRGELRAYAPNGAKSPPFIGAALTNSLLALAVYRFSHWLHLNGHRGSALWLSQLNFLLHKVTLPPGLCLGPGALMPHLGGCVLHGRAGQGLTFYAGSLVVSDDSAFSTPPEAAPWLGDDVLMAGNAGAFGPIVVGDGAQFGPKARSARDLASGRRIWDRLSRGSARPRQARGTPVRETRPRRLVLPDGGAWRETRRRMRRDRERLGATPRYPALTCSWLYRVSHAFHATGRPRFARWTWWLNVTLTGADISPCCEIGAGLLIPHPAGLALHGRAGEDLTLGALTAVTASLDEQDRLAPLDAAPWLGDNVRLEHHACVFGPIDVGDGAMILHGCVVAEPVPANATVAPMNPILQRVDSGHRHSAARNRERPLIGDPQLSDM